MYHNAARAGNRAAATGNRHKNLMKIGHVVPEICAPTDCSTTDTLIAILGSPAGGDNHIA